MAHVQIYTTMMCPYCHRAKALLEDKGVAFEEIDVTYDPKTRETMTARAGGRRTVPQIFIDGRAVGGSDELAALEESGELDNLLGRAA
ncbi:MAG: glutaredoxin 3 [Alphaproteobacteria bacterium]